MQRSVSDCYGRIARNLKRLKIKPRDYGDFRQELRRVSPRITPIFAKNRVSAAIAKAPTTPVATIAGFVTLNSFLKLPESHHMTVNRCLAQTVAAV